jgi:hypothetical protein
MTLPFLYMTTNCFADTGQHYTVFSLFVKRASASFCLILPVHCLKIFSLAFRGFATPLSTPGVL